MGDTLQGCAPFLRATGQRMALQGPGYSELAPHPDLQLRHELSLEGNKSVLHQELAEILRITPSICPVEFMVQSGWQSCGWFNGALLRLCQRP